MPSLNEYAQLASAVYNKTPVNTLPTGGWQANYVSRDIEGFEVTAYAKGDDIVIAYAGTNGENGGALDFLTGNFPAGLGLPSIQVQRAMEFYIAVRQANPNANISFTGHSLGGGLASLMAVYFDKPATVFDPAPFKLSALNRDTLQFYRDTLSGEGLRDADFDTYFNDSSRQYDMRVNRVTGRTINGEVLVVRTPRAATILTSAADVRYDTYGNTGMVNLHSMLMMGAIISSTDFANMIKKNSVILPLIFDDTLYTSNGQFSNQPDFMAVLMQKAWGSNSGVLASFSADLNKVGENSEGSSTQLRSDLSLAAMEYYYFKQNPRAEGLFSEVDGGVHFKYSDIGASAYKSLPRLVNTVTEQLTGDEKSYATGLSGKDIWYIQLGLGGLDVTEAEAGNTVAVGGFGSDHVVTGKGDDILIGNGGKDDLDGGEGNDLLLGGADADRLNGGGGDDTVLGGTGDDDINGDEGNDSLLGGSGKDILSGGEGTDTLLGEAGDDGLLGYDGNDSLEGGDGDDRLDGGADSDTLYGDAGDDTLTGDDGSDMLVGGAGDDVLYGNDGAGGDLLTGGIGRDIYYADDGDTIYDEDGQGEIWLNGKRLTEATRKKGETLYHDEAGNTYLLQGDRLLINDPLVVTGFSSGMLGIVLKEEDEDEDDPHDPPGKDLFDESILNVSPVVLDIDGGGIATRGIGAGAFFDYDNNGFAERTGWVVSGEGILVRDLDGDGKITRGAELFGDKTVLPSGAVASDGYAALSAVDSDTNGVLDKRDTAWTELKVWRDANGDGVSAATEMVSLNDAGVESIKLVATAGPGLDKHLNDHKLVSTFTRLDGSEGQTADIWFRVSPSSTRYETPVTLRDDLLHLPDLQGTGNVANLLQVMASDTSGRLEALVRQYAASSMLISQDDLLRMIIFTWAGVQDVDPASRGTSLRDARTLEALEAFYGTEFVSMHGYIGRSPWEGGSAQLESAFSALLTSYRGALDSQTRFKPWFDKIHMRWDATTQSLVGNLDDVAAVIRKHQFDSVEQASDVLTEFVDILRITHGLAAFSVETFLSSLGALGSQLTSIIVSAWDRNFATTGDDRITAREINGISRNDYINGGGGDDTIDGGTGDDHLLGDSGDDVLHGGAGDDLLWGGTGNDTFLFAAGDGSDTVQNSNLGEIDRLQFLAGITADDIAVKRVWDNLVLSRLGLTDSIVIVNYFAANTGQTIVHFADGVVWDAAAIEAMMPLAGTSNADYLIGFESANTITGQAGDDTISGRGGNDTLAGGNGDDSINGDDGDDLLSGGRGNDVLNGGMGADVYLYGSKDGHDIINDRPDSTTKVIFDDTIKSDQLKITRDQHDLIVFIGNQPGLTIKNSMALIPRLVFQFADGVIWYKSNIIQRVEPTEGNDYLEAESAILLNGAGGNDTLNGSSGDDTLVGGAGNDVVDGGGGSDIFMYSLGDGIDVIYRGSNGTIKLGAGIEANSVLARRDSAGRFLSFADGGMLRFDTTQNLKVLFDDGTVWDSAQLDARLVVGTAYDDALYVTSLTHQLDGGAGNDILVGDSSDDTFIGGEGDDILYGKGGVDVYRFARGDGRDVINFSFWDGDSTTVIEFSSNIVPEDLTVVRQFGGLLIIHMRGSSDSITLSSTEALPTVRFADGTTWSAEKVRDLSMLATEFDDYITAEVGRPLLDGLAGNDYLQGDDSNNTLIGGDGNDTLLGGMGDDVYVYSRGTDLIGDSHANNILRFDAGIQASEIQVSMQGGNMLIFVPGRGTIIFNGSISSFEFVGGTVWTYADMSNRRFIGGDGNETLQADGVDRVLNGNGGDDTLYGGTGSETLIGGVGNDLLSGSGGNDVFLYASGDGNDRIQMSYGLNDQSVLRFQSGIDPAALQLARDGQDVIVTITPGIGQITLVGWLNPSSRLSQLAFADGTVWNAQKILNLLTSGTSADDVLFGTADDNLLSGEGGNDRLSDWQGNDTLVGGTGDDWMQGGSGNNVYLYRLGDGVDEINDGGGIDELRFDATISVADVSVKRDDSSILLLMADGGAIKTSFYGESNYPLERIVFADGTIWTAAQLLATPFKGTSDNDQIYGSEFGDSIDGGAGDDYLASQGGADTITGGLGNDQIAGGAGDDVYRFARGDGRDMIYDAAGERNVVQLGAGISAGDVQFRRDADNVYLSISGTEDGITFTGWTGATPKIDRVEFADGTVLSAAAIWALASQPSAGDDWLISSGEAALHALDGNDTVTGGSQNDALYGDQGNDFLVGDGGADLIVGGGGDDTMYGGAGDDVYLVGLDDGWDSIVDAEGSNVVRFASGILPGQVFLHRVANGVLRVDLPGEQSIRIDMFRATGEEALPRFEFGDGTIWDVTTVNQMLLQGGEGNDWIVGTAAGDNMSGGDGSDSLYGGQGNDTLHGGRGDDVLAGDEGDDIYLYERGDGYDRINFEKEGKDTIQFGAGITAADLKFSRQSGALLIQVGDSADNTLLLQNWYGSASWKNIDIRFAGGEVMTAEQMAVFSGGQSTEGDDSLYGSGWMDTISGGGGNDYIDGGLGDDLLSGGAGNDTMNGGWGHDVLLFNRGDGRDTIYAMSSVAEDKDTLRFGDGITADDIQVYRSYNSMVLAITGTGDAVTIWPWFGPGTSVGLTKVEFADGTVWSPDDMLQRLVFPTTDGDDGEGGFEANDLIDGKDGDDWLWGGDGNDTLIGGRGDDSLSGDAGNDVYRYAQGDGSDRYKFETVGGADTLEFGEGVLATDIVMSRDLKNLYLRVGTSGESIVLEGWFGEDGYAQGDSALSRIVFADGTTWTPASTALQISMVTAGDLFVLGGAADETLLGYDGNDVLYGGAGNDTLDAGVGNNRVSGGEGNDVYRYSGGVLTIDDWSVVAGEQDRLEINGVGPGGLVLHNYSGDLAIVDSDGTLIIRINAYFAANSNGELKSGEIAFADGTVWSRATVAVMLPQLLATEQSDQLRLTTPGMIDGLGGSDHIVGVSSSTLHGGDGNDFLELAGVGNDAILHGDNGNDRLQVERGARDLLYGDAGDDSMQVRFGIGVMMDGGVGTDYLELNDGDNNSLYGDEGNDTIAIQGGVQSNRGYGGSGEDTLRGYDGNGSELFGDDGNDRLQWGRGSGHHLYGGDGNDQLQTDGGRGHLLDGGIGDDTLQGFSDNTTLLGGDGADTMQANNTGAWMHGGAGNDRMNIYAGNSTVIGGDGDDTLDGSNSNMVMRGGAGKDKLSTNGNFDLLDGGADDDTVYVGGGSDTTMLGSAGNDTLTLGSGARNLLDGGAGDDSLQAGGGSDTTMLGGEGNDTLTLSGGAQYLLDGGDGDDILQVGAYHANVVRGGAGMDTIGVNYGSAHIEGGSGNDSIKTGLLNQFVAGGTGDDLITLQNGADIVAFNLGDGKDTIDGTEVTATLSLGGGVEYADLLFSRDQADLILKVGDSDQLRLKDWYNADGLHRTISQLQFILDSSADYDAASSDTMRNQRTTLFNFQQLVDTFDSAQLDNPTLNAWSVTGALINAHLGGGNTEAIGGALAYQYGRLGNLDSLTMQASTAVLAAPEFGAARQQFQPLPG